MVGAEAEEWELPLEAPNVAISAASSCISSLISSRLVMVVSIQLVFAADNRETTIGTWKKKPYRIYGLLPSRSETYLNL